ncbi:MAG TPA: DUF3089 domain-containing protein [Solirubrobacteraceae bacterium]|nr:DUF3089 domain-containing protein [Solirubrobacteraceae bacterium]
MRGIGVVLTVAFALACAATAQAEVVWLCKPGDDPNPCHGSLETTVHEQDGTSRVENPPLAEDPAVDCFYVYPTVSEQPSRNANKDKDPEVVAIAEYQAARYAQACRVYAPMYRQQTLAGLGAGGSAEALQLAYGDVEEAWREYLASDNRGRPFVLVGHSQGTRMLRQLLRREIDPRPEVRARLVSALLLGGNVLVRKGQVAGGDFEHVPACTSAGQLGCVVAWSTFNEPPPPNSRYGRPPAEDTSGFGLPAGPEFEVLCTNPASLGPNERAEVTTYLRGKPFPGFIGLLMTEMYGGPQPSAPTPFLRPADRYTAKCEQHDGANVLMLEPVGSSRRLNPSPDPSWGLHLADANIALGELVAIVEGQIAALPKAAPPARGAAPPQASSRRPGLRIRCGKRPRVVGRDRSKVRRVRFVRKGPRVRAIVRLRNGRRLVLTRRCR